MISAKDDICELAAKILEDWRRMEKDIIPLLNTASHALYAVKTAPDGEARVTAMSEAVAALHEVRDALEIAAAAANSASNRVLQEALHERVGRLRERG